MAIPGYTPFSPPFPQRYGEWKTQQAREYFEWFKAEIPARLSALSNAVAAHPPVHSLDLSEACLPALGRWLDSSLTTQLLSEAEKAELKSKFRPEYLFFMEPWKFTRESDSLCIDVGIYLAEVLRSQHPNLKWDFVRRAKTSVDYHQTVLVGFTARMSMNPVRIAHVIAVKSVKGTSAELELPDTLSVWSKSA